MSRRLFDATINGIYEIDGLFLDAKTNARLKELGFIKKEKIRVVLKTKAFLIAFINGFYLPLRRREAEKISVL